MDALVLSEYLSKLRLLVNKKYEGSSINNKMSLAEIKLIMLLYRSKDYTLQTLEMAEYNKVTLAAIMHKLKTLEEKGYVIKSHLETDQRVKIYSLTEKGLKIAKAFHKKIASYNALFLSSLSNDEVEALEDILKKIISFMENN